MYRLIVPFLWLVMCTGCSQRDNIKQASVDSDNIRSAYLFSSFRDSGDDGLHLSNSIDRLNWHVINQGNMYILMHIPAINMVPCVLNILNNGKI